MALLWYFAYGSNMQSATLRERRGIAFTRALPARLAGWDLVLDKPPILPGAGTFANIVPDPSAHVLGVAFEITAEALDHLELSEGVRLGSYRRVTLTAEPLDARVPPIAVATLASDARDPAGLPTETYMGLLVAGALEHGLPAAWVARLRGVPTAAETDASRARRAFMDDALRALRPDRTRR